MKPPSIHPLSIYLTIQLSICLYLSIYLFNLPSFLPSMPPSIYLSVYLSIQLTFLYFIHATPLSIYLSNIPSFPPSIHSIYLFHLPSFHPPIYLYIVYLPSFYPSIFYLVDIPSIQNIKISRPLNAYLSRLVSLSPFPYPLIILHLSLKLSTFHHHPRILHPLYPFFYPPIQPPFPCIPGRLRHVLCVYIYNLACLFIFLSINYTNICILLLSWEWEWEPSFVENQNFYNGRPLYHYNEDDFSI